MSQLPQPESEFNTEGFEILDFGSLKDILELEVPPLQRSGFRQLSFIERHLRESDKPCKSVIVENHYIDRAFIEDYREFYATSYKQYKNSCRRIHFFSLEKDELKKRISDLFDIGRGMGDGSGKFVRACEDFSSEAYLGFSVIKPLSGSPVGRTVLSHYQKDAGNGNVRKFNCTRYYKIHFFGLEFTVCGLVFQQQDRAVSACATTALWTSLSKLKEFEYLRTPSPAQITKLATQHILHFGRPMPQENGLSVEQMCQAIQSLGLSPYLIRTDDLDNTKAYLHAAILSGFAPVLIIERLVNGQLTGEGHAVTATGMKMKAEHRPTVILRFPDFDVDELANDIVSIYVNDDRLSPYFRVEISASNSDLIIDFNIQNEDKTVVDCQKWKLSHILIPLHAKIRLSFAELREIAILLIRKISAFKLTYSSATGIDLGRMIQIQTWMVKNTDYIKHLFFGNRRLSKEKCYEFQSLIGLSRYIGVIRLEDTSFGVIDILIDTTNISKNPNFLGVICRASNKGLSEDLAQVISIDLRCPLIIDYGEAFLSDN